MPLGGKGGNNKWRKLFFTVPNGMILLVLRNWSGTKCRLIRYICLSVGETGRSTQGALIVIIVCGVC